MYSVCVFVCSGAVLSLAMGEEGKFCYSGGLDGSIRCWKSPDLNVDPYDNYGKSQSMSAEFYSGIVVKSENFASPTLANQAFLGTLQRSLTHGCPNTFGHTMYI